MEFREDVQVDIEAPGSDAVRGVVRRRRRNRTAWAAGGLALAFVGVWAVLRLADPTPGPAGPAGPDQPAIDYSETLVEAFTRAGYARYYTEGPNYGDPFWWGNTLSVLMGPRFVEYPTPATVTVTAACAGTGGLTVMWRAGNDTGKFPVSCEDDGEAVNRQVLLPEPNMTVHVSLQGDDQVTTGGAFVVALTDPRSVAALAALGPPGPGETSLGGITGTTYDEYPQGTQTLPVDPGRYRLTLVCLGHPAYDREPGTIEVRFSLGADRANDEVACPSTGSRLELVVASETATDLVVSVSEQGVFGYAFGLARVG